MRVFARLALLVLFVAAGYVYGGHLGFAIQGAVLGVLLGLLSSGIELVLRKVSFGYIIGGLIGLSMGLIAAHLLLLPFVAILSSEHRAIASFAVYAGFGYSGFFVGLHRGKNLTIPALMRLFKGQEPEQDVKLLDTSVIIDGRIADIVEAGFAEGVFVVPSFILQELQYIADSPDPMRRTKGRRGLDILHRMQKLTNIKVNIVQEDFPRIKEVDAKLIALAKMYNAKIITNDFNLNKVAQLQAVSVLNVNELANVLKPVVLPGESLNVFVVKEGKEHNQGVAYLDDGTMVVIENGRRLIGKNTDATVTSVLQTTAGRMIFARPKEEE